MDLMHSTDTTLVPFVRANDLGSERLVVLEVGVWVVMWMMWVVPVLVL